MLVDFSRFAIASYKLNTVFPAELEATPVYYPTIDTPTTQAYSC